MKDELLLTRSCFGEELLWGGGENLIRPCQTKGGVMTSDTSSLRLFCNPALLLSPD